MGRYYDGNISGKFWVGAQSSFSMNKFGATDKDRYEYACCGCHFDKDDTDYCQSCYESKEEHLEAVHEDEPDVDICFIEVPESDFEITKKTLKRKDCPSYKKMKNSGRIKWILLKFKMMVTIVA